MPSSTSWLFDLWFVRLALVCECRLFAADGDRAAGSSSSESSSRSKTGALPPLDAPLLALVALGRSAERPFMDLRTGSLLLCAGVRVSVSDVSVLGDSRPRLERREAVGLVASSLAGSSATDSSRVKAISCERSLLDRPRFRLRLLASEFTDVCRALRAGPLNLALINA